MEFRELIQTSLSPLERMLKRCFEVKPIFKDHVPSTEELMEYIGWMAREFGTRPEYQLSRDMVLDPAYNIAGNQWSEFAGQMLANPYGALSSGDQTDYFRLYKEDMFFSDENDISVGRMLRYMPSHWHSGDHFEVFYSFAGESPVYFTNETVTVKPGTVLIIAPGVTYASPCFSDDGALLFYLLRASTFDRVFWNQIPPENLMANFFRRALSDRQPNAYIRFETEDDPEIRQLLARIYGEFLENNSYRSQMMNSLMSEFFILLLRGYEGTARLPRNDDFYWKHEYSAILSYIQAHFESVSLSELAGRFHYSEKQIRRIIQTSTGMSFIQLITKLRMERASTLLKGRNASIDKISAAVGYGTVNSFYRTFTKYYGCTPGKFLENTGK